MSVHGDTIRDDVKRAMNATADVVKATAARTRPLAERAWAEAAGAADHARAAARLSPLATEAPVKTLEIPHRWMTLAYEDHSPPEAGTGVPVVLLHAFPFDRTMWTPQFGPLAGHGWRVLAPDFPQFGGSTPGANPFTVDEAADVVADFLGALKVERAVVGGLSMGGYVAMAFARRHPQRLAGLILADTKAEPDDATARDNRDKTITAVRADGPAAVGESMLNRLLSDASKGSPQVVEFAKGIATRQTEAAMTTALYALRDRPDAEPGLAAVAVPTLVIVGEFDAVTPPLAAARIATAVAGSELVHIPGAGHLSNVENPEAFNRALLKFLAKVKA